MRIGVLAALAGLAIVVARRLDVVEVRGRSMAPTLKPGDWLLVMRASPRTGDVVVTHDPRDPSRELVKRVARIGADGIALRGDNPAASTDGRTFGDVPAHGPMWRAVLRIWPRERLGPIRRSSSAFAPIDEGGEPACSVPEALITGS